MSAKTEAPTLVRVLAKHIRKSEPGNCHRCAVAMALHEATGDDEAHVIEHDWTLYLVIWGRWFIAPAEVRQFVREYDGLDRTEDGRARLPRRLTEDLAPFKFEIPPISDPEWEEACYGCEELFAPAALDDEGYCEGCREEEGEPGS